ncbi:MAG TPA: nucleotidyltransferase domain-containing protein [Clostridiales bacterium]|nr:nucleotidyltransferase domain-containing protein [Clostridiales bacterium]
MIYDSLQNISERYKLGIIEAINIILSFKVEGIKQIVLFGSCARFEINISSDIDLLVVTENPILDRILKSDMRSRAEELSSDLKADVVFSTKEMLEESEMLLYQFIREEGILMWKEGVFTDEYKQLLPIS